ncbi:phospholipase [Actinokineospora soli]|uniref:Phospholipase n=1 Tax=Actinokineospora soli TaxID=1048753 RepID=A0ABW2TVH9_9PSEU
MATSTLRRAARGAIASVTAATAIVLGAGTASAELSPSQLVSVTDTYLYSYSLNSFISTRNARPYATQLDWSSDACSYSPDNPFGYNFTPACHRHDFGYRNYKRQGRFTETTRLRIDNQFKTDMYTVCGSSWTCRRTADVYYSAVREFGRS